MPVKLNLLTFLPLLRQLRILSQWQSEKVTVHRRCLAGDINSSLKLLQKPRLSHSRVVYVARQHQVLRQADWNMPALDLSEVKNGRGCLQDVVGYGARLINLVWLLRVLSQGQCVILPQHTCSRVGLLCCSEPLSLVYIPIPAVPKTSCFPSPPKNTNKMLWQLDFSFDRIQRVHMELTAQSKFLQSPLALVL